MESKKGSRPHISRFRKVTIKRILTSPDFGTLGLVYLGDSFGVFCYSLECYYNDGMNSPFYDCIPEGEYRVEYNMSPKFERDLYILLNVPGRSGIRIHPASFAAHKPTYPNGRSDLNGCIAFGKEFVPYDTAAVPTRYPTRLLRGSRDSVDEFAALLGSDPFTLIIENNF